VCDGDGELSTDERAQLRADARALWSVRVLDAWACLHTLNGWASSAFGDGPVCVLYEGKLMHRYDGATVDTARHAAALAVCPTLPADVRAELGECP
jgi:hypothetical protein